MRMEIAQQPPRSRAVWHLTAIVAVAGATALILLVPPLVQRGAFVIFLAVVAIVTVFGGWRPGIVAIVLSALSAAMFVLPPQNSLVLQDGNDLLRLGVFLLVAGIIAALHALSDNARRAAWRAEQRLNFALHCANMGAWHSDLKSGKFWWSEGMERLFGRPPGEFSGTYEAFIGYIHPDDQDFVKRAVTRTIEGGKEFEIEHRIVRPDGQTRWILTRGRIVCDEDQRPKQVIGVAADVTERHQPAPSSTPAE